MQVSNSNMQQQPIRKKSYCLRNRQFDVSLKSTLSHCLNTQLKLAFFLCRQPFFGEFDEHV